MPLLACILACVISAKKKPRSFDVGFDRLTPQARVTIIFGVTSKQGDLIDCLLIDSIKISINKYRFT